MLVCLEVSKVSEGATPADERLCECTISEGEQQRRVLIFFSRARGLLCVEVEQPVGGSGPQQASYTVDVLDLLRALDTARAT